MDTDFENLNRYLEIEKILNRFFDRFNYCLVHCIQKQQKEDPDVPSVGCCKNKYYKLHDLEHPAFELLQKERVKLYGRPKDSKRPDSSIFCEYHTPAGCVLKSHKSPTCLSFLCRESIDFLRERYQIFEYDYLGIYYALEWILTGDMSGRALEDFKESCLNMVKTLNQKSG